MPVFSPGSDRNPGLGALAAAATADHPISAASTREHLAGQTTLLHAQTGYDSTAALPSKLVTRILSLEYVEMAELLPDAWP